MIVLPAGMGLGDILMHGPALDTLDAQLVVVEPRYLELAQRFRLAPKIVAGPCPHWTDHFSAGQRHALVYSAVEPRPKLFAEFMGVDWPRVFSRLRSCAPGDYIAVFPEAHEPRRSLSAETAAELARLNGVRVIGRVALSNLGALIDFIAGARAVIAVDSGPMHIAAVLGVPLVACFTHVQPSARLTFMGDGPQAMLVPPDWPDRVPPGELHPTAWGASITAEAIGAALNGLEVE